MSTIIYAIPTAKGIHSLFVETDGSTHFLFSQDYRRGVKEFFGKGVCLRRALDHSLSQNSAVHRTMDKLIPHIRYVEREHNVTILNQTKRKKQSQRSA